MESSAQKSSIYSAEWLISNFSEQPGAYLAIEDEISPVPRAQLSTIRRRSASSSLGRLNWFPPEILIEILSLLDFQSLSRVSRVSLRGKEVVEGLLAYIEIMEHARGALTALRNTGLLRDYSCTLLRQTLWSEKCVSCSRLGGLLFLPTCERICHLCSASNYAFHMMTLLRAKQFFALTDEHLEGRVPVLPGMDKIYDEETRTVTRFPCQLVSVKQVKQLAISIHGSMEMVAKLAILPLDECRSEYEREEMTYFFRGFHTAPLESHPGQHALKELRALRGDFIPLRIPFYGMALTLFPWLTEAGRDFGTLCRGCRELWQVSFLVPPDVQEELVVGGKEWPEVFREMGRRLRPTGTFLEHIKQCYGVHFALEPKQTREGWKEKMANLRKCEWNDMEMSEALN